MHGLSAFYSRIYCYRWPSPPAWHPSTVWQGSVRLNLTEEASPPTLFLSSSTYSIWFQCIAYSSGQVLKHGISYGSGSDFNLMGPDQKIYEKTKETHINHNLKKFSLGSRFFNSFYYSWQKGNNLFYNQLFYFGPKFFLQSLGKFASKHKYFSHSTKN